MKKVLMIRDSADCGASYYRPFAIFGKRESNVNLLKDNYKDIALVVFTGGEDVTPSVYNEDKHHLTYSNKYRDAYEIPIFERALELKIPIAGICRGAQLICAKSGGKLVQHISGHSQSHKARTDDGRSIILSSTHHQMQLPPPGAYTAAWAEPRLSKRYEGPNGKLYEPEFEYDCVYYPNTNALGMQYHPEYMYDKSEGFLYCHELIKRFLGLKEEIEAPKLLPMATPQKCGV